MFLDQLLRQSVLTHWLVQRRREHRKSLGLPIGALDPVERMFSKSFGSHFPPAPTDSDGRMSAAATADGGDNSPGRAGPRRSTGGPRQLPLRWTVHMDAAEASQMGLLPGAHSRAVGACFACDKWCLTTAYMLCDSSRAATEGGLGYQMSMCSVFLFRGLGVSLGLWRDQDLPSTSSRLATGCSLQEMNMTNAPSRVLTLLKQQAAELTHHHWATVRWRKRAIELITVLDEAGLACVQCHATMRRVDLTATHRMRRWIEFRRWSP